MELGGCEEGCRRRAGELGEVARADGCAEAGKAPRARGDGQEDCCCGRLVWEEILKRETGRLDRADEGTGLGREKEEDRLC